MLGCQLDKWLTLYPGVNQTQPKEIANGNIYLEGSTRRGTFQLLSLNLNQLVKLECAFTLSKM